MKNANPLKPLGWKALLFIFAISASALYVTHYVLVPRYTEATGKPYLIGYLWGWIVTVGLMFLASLVLYRLEGSPFSSNSFATRYGLKHMPKADWLWSLAVLIVVAGFMFGLSFTAEWLARIPFFAPHPMFPPELRPNAATNLTTGQFMGMTVDGLFPSVRR